MDPFLKDLLGKENDEFQTSTKTEEEIKKLTLEENMTEIKRTMHILSRGQPIQKTSVYLNLHKILLEPEAFNKILPLVSEEILNQSEENQIEAAKSLRKLLGRKGLTQTNIIQIFHVTCSVLKIWNQAVLDEWVLVFSEILKKIPYDLISKDAEQTIMSLSETSQHSLSKYIAVRMIGFVAENGIKNATQFFNRARILCQDPDFEIRKVLAEEVMLKICFNAGAELTESKYLEKIMELLYDSNISIKLAAIDSIVKVLDILTYDFKKNRMVFVFLELMNSVNEEVMKKMSFHIGTIVYKLEDVLPKNSNQLLQIQNTYREWSLHKSSEIRRNIIYNLPYMLRLYDNKEHFKTLYLKTLKENSNKNIRLVAVSCFHEVCKIFKAEDFPAALREAFESLLKETDTEVIEKLVINLADLIAVFHVKREEKSPDDDGDHEEEKEKDSKLRDIKLTKSNSTDSQNVSYLGDILKLGEQLKAKYLWRLEIKFMEHINKCYDYFDIRELGEKYPNHLVDRLAKGVKEVQVCAMDSLILFFKRNFISKRTGEVIKLLEQNFSAATNYQSRVLFLEIYERLAEKFSKRFFKLHGINEFMIKLGDDKVPEVRRKFFDKSLTIRKMLHQSEAPLVVKLEDAAARNRSDKNKGVAAAANNAYKELKSLTQYFFAEFEEEDKKRMAEEDILKEKEQRDAEEQRKKQGEDIQRDKGDYLYPFSSLMGANGRKLPPKKSIYKTEISIKNSKPLIIGPNTIALATPKTKPGSTLLPPAGVLKTHSTPTTANQIEDFDSKNKDGFSKFSKFSNKSPGAINGSSGAKKLDSLSAVTSGSKLSLSSDFEKGGLAKLGPSSNNKILSSNILKNEPKSSLPKIAPDNLPKDYVKVPTIKRKI